MNGDVTATATTGASNRPQVAAGSGHGDDRRRHAYVYAVGWHEPALTEAAAGAPGLDGAAVRTVCADGLSALVCDVPADAFGEEGLRGQMEDLDRLAAIARSHHALVVAANALTTVLPMRLGTVYRDEARVAHMLQEHGGALRTLLDRLEGHAEWGVKVYADPRAMPPAAAPQSGAATAGSASSAGSPGRAYLRQRRAVRDAHHAVYRTARDVVARIHEQAAALAAGHVAHHPQQGELATASGENLANDAYLVSVEHTDAFQAAVRQAAADAPGVRVEVTGPWAPYSFAATSPPAPETAPDTGSDSGTGTGTGSDPGAGAGHGR
ncbi:GvpL/GvpF family gas vesicle protein [Streptomyces zagrosensis]|uniref:Gas vesicle protein n=1 Tax=Streptomyces zagrosensis TaxID=1042984 RepID=A0A7W9QBF1_9ACTN|nr:GvpL/GvpF family gas vesicle protein [Streptomyces zagrosensis]MBB5937069.1 hypothetical protein [Streptomyces zagrosensis]